MRSKVSFLAFLVFVSSNVENAFSHDLWIEPSDFSPAVGKPVAVRLRVGQSFVGEPLPRIPDLIDHFFLSGPGGIVPIPGVEKSDPAGYTRAASEGVHLIGYQSHPFHVDVEPGKFEGYLVEEGLEMISFLRQQRGEIGTPGNERFSRCAKALIAAGSGPFQPHLKPLDFILEILPEIDSIPLKVGDSLSVQLRYEGKPYAGALLKALPQNHPNEPQTARSNREGKVTFHLKEPGVWLIKAVHMIEADSEVDWESFWASLTFEVME